MAGSNMPYQCLEKCGKFLVAARGSNIDLFNVEDGSFIFTWSSVPAVVHGGNLPAGDEAAQLQHEVSQLSSVNIKVDASPPPAKRRKLSGNEDEKSETKGENTEKVDPESKGESKENEKTEKKQKKQKQNNRSETSGFESPSIIALATTNDAKHVVAITGEDKAIRVFEIIETEGVVEVRQISQRVMPKRPSALTITSDSTTIISADKFGDVYSLPLLFSESPLLSRISRETSQVTNRPFKPSANEFTIHSQRNRKALENQKRQLALRDAKETSPAFEHNLLLGHVSLLTDVKLAVLDGRNYIITADRDEHIRISRGIPQAHIIETFCLGHKEFVSRICVPGERPEILISGGGDNDLFVWRWANGELLSCIDIEREVAQALHSVTAKVVVSGIYHMRQSINREPTDLIIVTCEGVPALITLTLTSQNTLQPKTTILLPGNVLSLISSKNNRIILSIDTIYKAGSTTEVRNEDDQIDANLLSFTFERGDLIRDMNFRKGSVDAVEAGRKEVVNVTALKTLLYSLENLRKRDNEGGLGTVGAESVRGTESQVGDMPVFEEDEQMEG
ncbi:hypothetical protein BGZ60DRAFT_526302 [Tricladium varicosporioides]|nr:hypothetical protein BGZ60DRAFT_526302 [Hymenoscyphus varicosporioides]